MAYQYSLTTIIPASAREIYDAWLDSVAHSKMTGGQAKTSAELGAEFMAWDGYITGRNLELRPGERIVQAWRTTKFPEDHEDSIVTVTLEEREDGTLLTLSHSNVPDGHLGYEQGGWQKSYFEPMIAFFSDEPAESGKAEQEPQSEPEAQPAAEERAPRRPARKPAPKARAKLSEANKPAAAPKAPPRSVAAKSKKKAATPKGQPKRGAARKKPAAKKKAPVQKARRKTATTKAKTKAKVAQVRSRAKPKGRRAKVQAKVRARPARAARRGSAGRRRR